MPKITDKYITIGKAAEAFSIQTIYSYNDCLNTLFMAIREEMIEPESDVAPVAHGKWEWVNEDRYRCDRCEQITTVDECMGKPIYNFCPNCGARMDGKEPNNEQSNRNR